VYVGARNLPARYYAVTGGLRRDIWYGPDGQIVQVVFPALDGSQISFVIHDPSQSPTMEQRVSSSSSGADGKVRLFERK
jgi:hypothetical protein